MSAEYIRRYTELSIESSRFRDALEKIARPFDSGPATFVQAHMIASEELKRRMQIAADALNEV